jgi:hypothetical protein
MLEQFGKTLAFLSQVSFEFVFQPRGVGTTKRTGVHKEIAGSLGCPRLENSREPSGLWWSFEDRFRLSAAICRGNLFQGLNEFIRFPGLYDPKSTFAGSRFFGLSGGC